MEKFWMVLVEGTKTTSYIHYTLDSAKAEAERLASLPRNRGKRVAVLESITYCKAPELVKWQTL